ncbi:IPT/TIG domain-containing protein [Kitasatospora sp. NPDC018058]|uniref:IPT/TIG domain-containing protein n=1 Tax=Kitasatospora sp. NPDC018058 TaxID=3364025 RepID=UPI0037BE5430
MTIFMRSPSSSSPASSLAHRVERVQLSPRGSSREEVRRAGPGAPPTLTGISPSQGPATGGTVVTVTGTNLAGASVTIGGNTATNVTINAAGTQITATTPPGAAGPATVTTAGGTANLVGGFTYLAPNRATSLTATPAPAKLFPPQVFYPVLNATLTDLVTGLPVPGQAITFSTGTQALGTAVTNAQGIAQLSEAITFPLILANGGYTAAFTGAPTCCPPPPTQASSPLSPDGLALIVTNAAPCARPPGIAHGVAARCGPSPRSCARAPEEPVPRLANDPDLEVRAHTIVSPL